MQSLRFTVGQGIRLFTWQMYFTIAIWTFWDDYAALSNLLFGRIKILEVQSICLSRI